MVARSKKGAGTIKRRGRPAGTTKAELAARFAAIREIVQANQPTGIRFTYYTATTRGIVPKTDSGYRMVQQAILQMRRQGVLPWAWIVDSNRWMRKPPSYGDLSEAVEDFAAMYRRALWRNSSAAVEVWCESESVAGVLYPITSKWDVPLYPMKGQSSDTFVWGAAQTYKRDPRQLHIFYVGDHDPHGYEIETQLHAKLLEHSGRTDISFQRLACDADDVARLGLAGGPAKKSTYRDALVGRTVAWEGPAVEVEAIEPPTLRGWLDSWISEYADKEAIKVLEIAEESEREAIRIFGRERAS